MCDTAGLIPEEKDIPSCSGFVNPASDNIQNTELNLEHNWNEPSTVLTGLDQYDQSKDRQPAVILRHAFKSYDNSKNPIYILNNLMMTVAKGSIYGLLGASGCGKTTLLSCIVGRRTLDSGEILVLGNKPGTKGSGVPGKRVGYMPQEIALFGEFTIRETMMYFGWIFDMETNQIDDKMHFLLKFLDLPPEEQFVKNLSGGQQRRVSFAVALIHDPELLILDEPTVGVDPLLRQNIWDHLVRLTITLKKTVIITTHYIEEARQAHKIGLMRSGKLLAEASPQALLITHNSPTLEEVFFKLSREQGVNVTTGGNISNDIKSTPFRCENNDKSQSRNDTTNIVEDYNYLSNNSSSSNPVRVSTNSNLSGGSNFTSTGKMKALLKKNWLRMWRNIGMMMIIFALPVIQVNLFCLSIGRDPIDLKLAIVNHEINWGNESCPVVGNCLTLQSCRYLNFLDPKTIIKEYYETLELANSAVRKGNAWGTLYITENFTRNLIMLSGKNSNNRSDIHVWLDLSNQQIGFSLIRVIQSAYENFIINLSETCHVNIEFPKLPVEFENPTFGSENTTFTSFLAPGIILSIIFFLALSLTSSALILERTEGLLDRSWVAGVSAGEILLSHMITQFIVMCIQTALIYLFVIHVYSVECNGDIAWVLILTLLQGLCGMCFGFFISSICEHERSATQLALGSFYPILMLSGIIWPEEGMPMILRCISKFLPLTLATSSLRSMMSRGWLITESGVYIGFTTTIIWIVVFLTMSMCFLKFKRS